MKTIRAVVESYVQDLSGVDQLPRTPFPAVVDYESMIAELEEREARLIAARPAQQPGADGPRPLLYEITDADGEG